MHVWLRPTMFGRKQLSPLYTQEPLRELFCCMHSITTLSVKGVEGGFALALLLCTYCLSFMYRIAYCIIMQPGIEQHSGQLDFWPVHSLNPAHSNLSMGHKSSSLHSYQPQRSSVINTAPRPSIQLKPKFLEQLESYLSKELRLLGCPPTGPHELRLQAYREVFEYLIEDFKTYKGLLSAIKNEYELYLDYQEEVIKELKPMRVSG